MRARAFDDEPFWALDPLFIGLWVLQIAKGHGPCRRDLPVGSMPDDDALTRDRHRQAFAWGHRVQADIQTAARVSLGDARRNRPRASGRAQQRPDTSHGSAAEIAARDRFEATPAWAVGAHARQPPSETSLIAGRERRPRASAPAARRRWECA